MKCVHVVVRGRVQGVCFRQSAQREARGLGLGGWVRNRRDGTVESVALGADEAVDRYVAWCRRGPETARVDGVDVSAGAAETRMEAFDVRATE